MQRALFLALRDGFYEEWQPRGGVERALLDSITLAYCCHLYWVEETQRRATTEPTDIDGKRRKDGYWYRRASHKPKPSTKPQRWLIGGTEL